MLPFAVQVHRYCHSAAVPCALHDADILGLVIILIQDLELSTGNLRICVPDGVCLLVVVEDA